MTQAVELSYRLDGLESYRYEERGVGEEDFILSFGFFKMYSRSLVVQSWVGKAGSALARG